MFGPLHNIVFDFDGTLVDSMSAVVEGLSWAIAQTTCHEPSREDLVKTFGPPPLEVLKKWVSPERLQEAHDLWLDFEANAPLPAPFAGVPEMLMGLNAQKIELGIFTGRDRRSTEKILKALDWEMFWKPHNVICGDDGFAPKPSGAVLIHLRQKNGWVAQESLMVGDHIYDQQAARAAGFRAGAALWDKPQGPKTERGRFRAAWQNWEGADCDVRLAEPLSLLRWIQGAP